MTPGAFRCGARLAGPPSRAQPLRNGMPGRAKRCSSRRSQRIAGRSASALSAMYQSGWSQIVPRGCREVTGCEIWAARCVQPHRNPARAPLATPEFSLASPPTAHPFQRFPITFDALCYTQMGLRGCASGPKEPERADWGGLHAKDLRLRAVQGGDGVDE